MNVIDQLQQMTDDNYNPTKLKNELEALFKEPENFKIYQETIEHNCYLNTESGAGLNNNVNLHKPTQPRMPPISIGGGIGEQRGENKRIVFTLN